VLKKEITFEDFDGNAVTETYYFNLTKAELVEMEVSSVGGFAEQLNAIVAANDGKAIIDHFKKIILMSYGQRSEDGKRFVKNEKLTEDFVSTNADSALFMELATDADAAANFIKAIVPSDLANKIPEVDQSEDLSALSKEELLKRLGQ
jgi:hypothetical protein